MKVIAYKNDEGIFVVIPTPDFADKLDVVAAKDVPADTPYRIMDRDELPPFSEFARWVWSDEGPITLSPVAE